MQGPYDVTLVGWTTDPPQAPSIRDPRGRDHGHRWREDQATGACQCP